MGLVINLEACKSVPSFLELVIKDFQGFSQSDRVIRVFFKSALKLRNRKIFSRGFMTSMNLSTCVLQ